METVDASLVGHDVTKRSCLRQIIVVDAADYFHVFKQGRLTVIGFEAHHLTDSNASLQECRDRLLIVIREHHCQVLAVDLMSLGLVSSWVLAILAVAHREGIEVHLYHPSRDIQEVLEITQLDELLKVRPDLMADD